MTRTALTAFALGACVLAACGSSGRPAARVAGTVITKGDVQYELKRAGPQKPGSPVTPTEQRFCAGLLGRSYEDVTTDPKTRAMVPVCGYAFRTDYALSLAIERQWTLHEAAAEGMTMTNAQLHRALARFKGATKDEVRIIYVEDRLRDKLAPVKNVRAPGALLDQAKRFRAIMRSKWLAKTVCLNGYSATGTFSSFAGAACRNP